MASGGAVDRTERGPVEAGDFALLAPARQRLFARATDEQHRHAAENHQHDDARKKQAEAAPSTLRWRRRRPSGGSGAIVLGDCTLMPPVSHRRPFGARRLSEPLRARRSLARSRARPLTRPCVRSLGGASSTSSSRRRRAPAPRTSSMHTSASCTGERGHGSQTTTLAMAVCISDSLTVLRPRHDAAR